MPYISEVGWIVYNYYVQENINCEVQWEGRHDGVPRLATQGLQKHSEGLQIWGLQPQVPPERLRTGLPEPDILGHIIRRKTEDVQHQSLTKKCRNKKIAQLDK